MREGGGARIEEIEQTLRLAEQTANHIYGRYKELAEESNEEKSESHAVSRKMQNVSSELQEAIGQIPKQAQSATTVNIHAQMLNNENTAMRHVAEELQMRMLALQAKNEYVGRRRIREGEAKTERTISATAYG